MNNTYYNDDGDFVIEYNNHKITLKKQKFYNISISFPEDKIVCWPAEPIPFRGPINGESADLDRNEKCKPFGVEWCD